MTRQQHRKYFYSPCLSPHTVRTGVRQRAYTLVQLLFVIAIAAAITSASFTYMSSERNTTYIHVAATEMQRLFEAAIRYYNLKGVFPTSYSKLVDEGILPSETTYKGLDSKNPWGETYYFSSTTAGNFFIFTNVKNMKNADTLAQMLPNSSVSGSRFIAASISEANKTTSLSPGMLLAGVDINVVTAYPPNPANCTNITVPHSYCDSFKRTSSYTIPAARVQEIKGRCNALGRTAGFVGVLTGFGTGSSIEGRAPPYLAHAFSTAYVSESPHKSAMATSNNWKVTVNMELERWKKLAGIFAFSKLAYGQVMILYYCDKAP